MRRVFFDHLILIEEVLVEIDELPMEKMEKEKLHHLIDDIVHHKVMTHIFDLLPQVHHEEFLIQYTKAPHDITHLIYLERKTNIDIKTEIIHLGKKLKQELKKEIHKHSTVKSIKKPKSRTRVK